MIRKHQQTWAILITTAVVVLIAAYIDVFLQNRVPPKPQSLPQKTHIDKSQIQHDIRDDQQLNQVEHNVEIIKAMGSPHQHANKPRFDTPNLPPELQNYLQQRQNAEFQIESTPSGFRLETNGQWEVVTMAVVAEDGSITLVERQVQPQRPIDLPAPSS